MKISRRKFIGAGGLAAAAVLAGGVSGQSRLERLVAGSVPADALSQLTWDSFYPFQTTEFAFTDVDGNAVILKLAAMTDTSPAGFKPTSKYEECFKLVFSGPARERLPEGTYAVRHFALGDFELFISDGGQVSRSNRYVAVINRITR
jgi:hypothetical protein